MYHTANSRTYAFEPMNVDVGQQRIEIGFVPRHLEDWDYTHPQSGIVTFARRNGRMRLCKMGTTGMHPDKLPLRASRALRAFADEQLPAYPLTPNPFGYRAFSAD